MNEDFSEVISKFKNILEEKNINIPNSLGNTENASEESDGFDIDIASILKIKNMISSVKEKNSPRIQLLKALKPFLQKERQEKLEEYIKLANIMTILEILGENRR